MPALRESQNKRVRKREKNCHDDLGCKKKERDECKVRYLLYCLQNWVPGMWEITHPITNTATGEVATESTREKIQSAKRRGEDAREEFMKGLLQWMMKRKH